MHGRGLGGRDGTPPPSIGHCSYINSLSQISYFLEKSWDLLTYVGMDHRVPTRLSGSSRNQVQEFRDKSDERTSGVSGEEDYQQRRKLDRK